MTGRYVLTLDLGSSAMRSYAVPIDRPWELRDGAERRYRIVQPRGGEGLWRRFADRDLRARILDTLASALAAGGVAAADVAAISVTAQRGGTALLDAAGHNLYVGPNTDLRAVFEGAAIDDQHAEDVYATTGHLPSMFFTPAKLHWWREHHPRTAARIANVATLGAWTVRELTGVLAETPQQLAEAGLLDVKAVVPAAALLTALGIAPALVPSMVETGTATGGLTREAAEATGLAEATPVYLAGPDAQVASLGAGSVAPGDTAVIAGWSAPVQRVTSTPTFDPRRRTWTGVHAVPGHWVAEANPGDTGGTVEAIRRLLGPRMSLARFDALAASAPYRTEQVMALFGPRVLNMSNPGMSLGGLITPVPITYDGIDAGTVARATLENVAFAIRECLALLDDVAPASHAPLALTGGMAASPVFTTILADTLGRVVRVHGPRAAGTGAALIASRPPREWASAAGEIARHGAVVEPDASRSLERGERYEHWRQMKARLDALAEEL